MATWGGKDETSSKERASRRLLRRVVVQGHGLNVDLSFGDATLAAALSDVSGGGCCLRIVLSPFEETAVPVVGAVVTVLLPTGTHPLSCSGRVVSVVTDGGVGYVEAHIRFQGLTIDQRGRLQGWLAWLARRRFATRSE